MRTTRILTLIVLMMMAGGVTMQGRAQKPFRLQVGATGYASWLNPDYLEQAVFDFNDGQLPEGWTLESEGDIIEPWHFESPATNPQLNFPSDGSAYIYAHSDQLNGTDFMKEKITSAHMDIRGYKSAFIQFDYDYFEDWDDTEARCYIRGNYGPWDMVDFDPWNAQVGRYTAEITEKISQDFQLQFYYKSNIPDNHFAIDNVIILGETEEPVSNNVLGFRLWLDGALLGDVTETEYQIDTDTLQEGHDYTLSVASILTDGITDIAAFTFTYYPCSNFDGVYEFHGEFIDSTRVELTWDTPYNFKSKNEESQRSYFLIPDVVTHPGAGYNDGWDVSALHDGLTAYGYNADKEAGFKVMDKFTIPEAAPTSFAGLRFYVYEGPTPTSTITGAYLTIYDDDPLDGGNLIGGSEAINCLYQGWLDCYEWAHIYRTGENDFSDVSRPVCYAIANLEYWGMGMQLEPNHTYWFVASFTGSLRDDVQVIPVTRLDETTTGEARIYSDATGWQPMLDPGTQTQQGIAFDVIGYLPVTFGVAYSDIFRDGELIAHGVNQCYFVDENAPHGIHTYSIQNVYHDPLFFDYPTKACLQSIEVRPCYPPKNFEVSTEPLNGTDELNRLSWDKEDDIPLRDDVKTYYEVYRKSILEDQYALIGTLAKDNALDSFEYLDTVPQGSYYYKVNDYNIYPTGSCQSSFANQYGECVIIGSIAAEAEWSQGTDGVKLEWGEDLIKECFHFDTGDYIDAVGINGNFWWGIKMTHPVGPLFKEISLYSIADGMYDFMVYSGGDYTPNNLVWQESIQLNGVNQWHTIVLDEPYRITTLPVWIIIHQSGIAYPAAVAADDGSSSDGRWWSQTGNSFTNDPSLGGSFMIRANIDNCTAGEDLLQLEEPTMGELHYNLYRSHDNGSYEKIAQFPFPGYWSHVSYFDLVDDMEYSCYNYKVTITTFIDSFYCESQPAPNAENPLIDWAEVCNTWKIEETVENEHVVLYPNPAKEKVSIEGVEAKEVLVYNTLGQVVKSVRNSNEVSLKGLAQGVYMVRIRDKEGRIFLEKVMVR